MAEIAVEHVSKVFPGDVRAVDDVSLEIVDGEFMVLVGPSGCGKSTLLRSIAGLEEVSAGRIVIGGRDVTDAAPRERDIAMVFQSYALYPHMTVRQKLGYGLKVRKTSKQGIERRVLEVAKLLRLDGLLDRRPALRRATPARGDGARRRPRAEGVPDGRAALEPRRQAARVDAGAAREPARSARDDDGLRHARPGGGDDARTARRRDARRADPAGRHAAGALPLAGEPVRRRVHRLARDEPRRGGGRRGRVEFGSYRIPLGGPRRAGRYVLGIRPEAFEDAAFADPSLPQIDVDVHVVEELGSDAHVIFTIDAPPVETEEVRESREADDALLVADRAVFTARANPGTAARPGAPLRLAVDPARFHFFDPETGANVAGAPARVAETV